MADRAEFSVDVDGLSRFVAVADRRADEVEDLFERLRWSRAGAVATGLAGPVVSREADEALLGRIRQTDRFVAGVRDAFLTDDAAGWLRLDSLSRALLPGRYGVRGGPSAAAVYESVTDLIDNGDDLGISERELDRVHDHFVELNDDDLHDVLSWLSDEQLERLFHNVHSSSFWSNDWTDAQRHDFYQNLMRAGATGDAELWDRLGEFSPRIAPDPRLGGNDTARSEIDQEKREFWDGLSYTDSGMPLGGDAAHPIDYTQVRQGGLGDCYLVTALIALAMQDPEFITDIVTENPNGTYTVAFADGTVEVVSPSTVIDAKGKPAFARNADGTAWSAVIEKAYAQRFGGFGRNPGITGGQVHEAVEELSGRDGSFIRSDDLDFDDLADRFDRGELLGLNTIDMPDGVKRTEWLTLDTTPDAFKGPEKFQSLHPNHAFVVVDVDRAGGTVLVVNPWNPAKPPLELTFEAMQEAVIGVEVNAAAE